MDVLSGGEKQRMAVSMHCVLVTFLFTFVVLNDNMS